MRMSIERSVAQHYAHGRLEAAILAALTAAGKDIDHLAATDLAPVDEFHIGGRQATADLAQQLDLEPGMHLLDIGSGLGGAARYFAGERRCRVTGIDLTQEYVDVSTALARRVGFADRVTYQQGSALALPFPAASFDGAYLLHVGMNIEDKAGLLRGARRVLKRGAAFAVYDVMRIGEGALSFPVPWATTAETSFVAAPETYRTLLEAAGFEIEKERGRRQFAVEFFRQLRARVAEAGPSPLGLNILMGADFPAKMANMIGMLERGLIAPTEMICRAL
jgi:ubiquinone/menaquinone biosynthesis C-methylase UbiE